MKNVVLALVVIGLVAGWGAGQAIAQDKKVAVSLNAGVQTNIWHGTSFDNAWFTLDLRVGVPLGASLELAPELMYATDDSFEFWWHNLYPGILVNYRSGGFFAGVGVVLPIGFGDGESDTASPSPKLNLGYDIGRFKLTGYCLFLLDSGLAIFDMNQAGITIGYRF